MMIFRYHMVDGRSFDEAVPKEVEALSLAEVREFVARVVCPAVAKKEQSRLEPAFHILTLDGNAHLIITHNLVDVEIMVAVDPVDFPSSYQVEVHSGPGERGTFTPQPGMGLETTFGKDGRVQGYTPDQTEPGPGHLRLAASNGVSLDPDALRRRTLGPPGGSPFN